jgi:hypothetical protein
MLLYAARRVWRLKQRLEKITNILTAAERSTHAVLYKAPQAIYTNQQNIRNLRQANQLLELQMQQIRQIFSLLATGQQLWLRYFARSRSR